MANIDINTTKAAEIVWGGRAEAALKNGGLMEKTLAEIAKLSDAELLSIDRLGQKSLNEIRQKTAGEVQAKAKAREEKMAETNSEAVYSASSTARRSRVEREDEVVQFSKNHPNLIKAIMAGEVKLDYNI